MLVEANRLSTATGQLGPTCAITENSFTFAEAIVLDDKFVSFEAYIEFTGAESSTEGKDTWFNFKIIEKLILYYPLSQLWRKGGVGMHSDFLTIMLL